MAASGESPTTTSESAGARETIGQRLRRLRLERGLSQRDLAEPGVSYAYISRIEADARRPSLKALRILARSLRVSPEYLETGLELRDLDDRELRLAEAELDLLLGEQLDRPAELFAGVVEEATTAGDRSAAVRALVGLGVVAARRNQHEEAVRLIEEAIGDRGARPVSEPAAFVALARSYTALGRAERAAELLETALGELQEVEPVDAAARIRFAGELATVLAGLAETGQAERVLAETLSLPEEAADPRERARVYRTLVRAEADEGRPRLALTYARRALSLLEVTSDAERFAQAHLLYATILVGRGSAAEAEQHLECAEGLLGSHPDPTRLARVRIEQARAHVLLERADDAIARSREALELLGDEETGAHGEASAALAEALALAGDDRAADEAFGRAVAVLAREGPHAKAADAYRAWGKFLRRSGRHEEALDVLERAADLAVRAVPQGRFTRGRSGPGSSQQDQLLKQDQLMMSQEREES